MTENMARVRLISIVAVTCLVLAAFAATTRDKNVNITAHFASTVGLYKGSEVRLMGVPIGHVTAVVPQPGSVRVDMEYDRAYKLPADAKAVVISPSVVADRFVQLTPTYEGNGPVLADNADIPMARTAIPVELDRIYQASHDLMTALGPQGANKDGALSRAISVGADNLAGNGTAMHQMIKEFSGAMGTLGASSGDFFDTVDNLETLSSTLAANDAQVRQFNTQMESVAGFLDGERDEFSALLKDLAGAFGTVEAFVRQNRALFAKDLDGLVEITDALTKERKALIELTEITGLGLNNLNRTWDPVAQAVRTRSQQSEVFRNLSGAICDSMIRSGVPDPQAACAAFKAMLAETAK